MSTEPDRIDAANKALDAQCAVRGDVIVVTGRGFIAAWAARQAAAAP